MENVRRKEEHLLAISALIGIGFGVLGSIVSTWLFTFFANPNGTKTNAETITNTIDFISAIVFLVSVLAKIRVSLKYENYLTVFEGFSGGFLAIAVIGRLFFIPFIKTAICSILTNSCSPT